MNEGLEFGATEAHFRVLSFFEFAPCPSPPGAGIAAIDAALAQARMDGELVWERPQLPGPDGLAAPGQPLVPDDYCSEFLEPITQLLFGRGGFHDGRYYRLSHPLQNTIFRGGLWLWPGAATVKGVEGRGLEEPPWKLLPGGQAELFLLGSGVGLLSISLSLKIEADHPIALGDLKQLNYHLCQQRHRAFPALALPHPELGPPKPTGPGRADREKTQPLPVLSAPLDQRLGRPGGVFTLVELKDFLLGYLCSVVPLRETHPQFSSYSVVVFPHSVRLEDEATRANLAPLLSGMAQLEERDHAGTREVTVPHALLNRCHWAAVGPQAAVHFLADQYPRQDGRRDKFDAQRAGVVSYRYFIPWLMAALPRLQFQWAVREAAAEVAPTSQHPQGQHGDRLQSLQSLLLEFDALVYGSEVSARASHNRFYVLCQQGLQVDALYEDAARAVNGLASLWQLRRQQAMLQQQAEQSKQLVQLANALQEQVQGIHGIQRKVEYVEVFLVSVYAVYLVNYLGENLGFQHHFVGWTILVGSTLAALLAIQLLKPHHGDPAGAHKLWIVTAFILGLILFYLLLGFSFFRDQADHQNPPATREEMPAHEGAAQ